MRILQLGKYWNKDGGIETHVKTLCRGLASAGLDIVNLVSSTTRQASRFNADGYQIIESPSFGTYFSTSIAPGIIADVRRLNHGKPFDLIHLHFPDPMSHLASMTLPSHIPRVITWHSDIVKQRHLLKLYRPFQRQAICNAKAIITATQSLFDRSTQVPLSYPDDRRHVIPFGIDFHWLEPTSDIQSKAQSIKTSTQSRFLIFALGRHVEYKGFDVLIDAIRHTDAHLILGGGGPLTRNLQAQTAQLGLNDRISFTGRLSNEDIAAHYHACDVFCLPSITPNEAFGIVQVEAMACGKPVICTQLNNGVNEVNLDGVTGLSVPTKDSHSLAKAINRLIADAALRNRLGMNAKKHALSVFSVDKMVDRHLTLYEQLVRSRSS